MLRLEVWLPFVGGVVSPQNGCVREGVAAEHSLKKILKFLDKAPRHKVTLGA